MKLCDFGFARALSHTTLVLTSIKGTPLYMAPELVQEHEYNEKVDIWSLGIILYELYYGVPPYNATSIYKLIQMIVNNAFTWPGPISDEFKYFLLEMLQKNPVERTSADKLLKHPFLADVDFTKFNDESYVFKADQFEKALKEVNNDDQTTGGKDYHSILVDPKSHSDEELFQTIQFLLSMDQPDQSGLSASFVFNFSYFLSRSLLMEGALQFAAKLLSLNYSSFSNSLKSGISILTNKTLPSSIVPFFLELLVFPYVEATLNGNPSTEYDFGLVFETSEKLRDKFLGFLFTSDPGRAAETYVLFNFFAKVCDIFLKSLISNTVSQIVPILTSATRNEDIVISSSAFSLLTLIFDANPAAFQFVQPYLTLSNIFFQY